MKNFLKSTAIFACTALLFCACETDSTETGAGSAPEGVVFSPGENRAMVSWSVPEDSTVEGYTVTWKDSDGKSSKTTLLATGSSETVVTQLTAIPTGTVTVSLDPMSGSGGSTTLSTTVYDASTYASKTPTVYNIDFDSANLTAEIEWGSIDSDCLEVEVTYTDVYGSTVVMERAPIDDNVILTNIEAGLTITYTAYFCPIGGLDEVTVTSTATLDTAPYAPTNVSFAPGLNRVVATWVLDFDEEEEEEETTDEETTDEETTEGTTAQQGPGGQGGMTQEERIAALMAEIDGTVIRAVNKRTDAVTVITIPLSDHTDSLNTYSLPLSADEYDISLYTIKESGATSSVTDASATVTVYSEYDYVRTDAFQSTVNSTSYVAGTGISSVTWSYVPVNSTFIGVEITYLGFDVIATPVYTEVTDENGDVVYDEDGNALTEITSYDYSYSTTDTSIQTSELLAATGDSSTTTDLYNALANEEFSYASCFCPEGGCDTIRIYSYETPTSSANSSSFVFVEDAPLTAETITLTSGFTTDDEGAETAYVTATCFISSITDISSYVVEVSIDGEIDESLTTEYAASDVTYDSDLVSYVITEVYDDVKVGSDYVVSVTAITASFTENTSSSDALVPYNTSTYEALEPNVTAICNDATTVTVLWENGADDDATLYDDITNVAVLYGNQSKDYTLAELQSGISLTLLSQSLVNTLYYTTTYQPASGDTAIVLTTAVPVEVEPSAPKSVALTSGYDTTTDVAYVVANVEIVDVSNIAKYVVDLSVNGVVTEGYKTYTDVDDSYKANGIEIIIDNATVGAEYIVSVYAVTTDGEKTATSASNTLVPYNVASYSQFTPVVSAVNSSGTEVYATWSGVSTDMTSIVVNYNGVDYNDYTYANITSFVVLDSGTSVPQTFTYTITYQPSTGLIPVVYVEEVTVSIEVAEFDIVLNSEGVYEIYTGVGLRAYADIVNGVVNTTAKTDDSFTFTGSSVNTANGKLMSNVDLSEVCSAASGENWTPIGGTSNSGFKGTFDGNGKIISNMYISMPGSAYQGLFGYPAGTITSVVMLNPYVANELTINGVIAGRTTGTTVIKDCYVTGTGGVYGSGTAGAVCGGIVGNNSGLVLNCHIDSGIEVVGVAGSTSRGSAGGITATSGGYIIGCTTAATVNGNCYHAGIVGFSAANLVIVGCVNSGEINTSSGGGQGGIVGRLNGSYTGDIIGCVNTGYVYSNSKNGTAGIIGLSSFTTNMIGCYNTGDIDAGTQTTNIGALVGSTSTLNTVLGNYFVPTTNMQSAWLSTSSTDALLAEMKEATTISELNAGVSTMNSAISANLSDIISTIESTYGYTISCSYVDGGADVPVMNVTYTEAN
ncbi:MAG: DUF4998 domain-containing protein [Rikenellaceae bacterium]